jgi:hypothetical protein
VQVAWWSEESPLAGQQEHGEHEHEEERAYCKHETSLDAATDHSQSLVLPAPLALGAIEAVAGKPAINSRGASRRTVEFDRGAIAVTQAPLLLTIRSRTEAAILYREERPKAAERVGAIGGHAKAAIENEAATLRKCWGPDACEDWSRPRDCRSRSDPLEHLPPGDSSVGLAWAHGFPPPHELRFWPNPVPVGGGSNHPGDVVRVRCPPGG